MAADISVGIGVLGEKEFKKALDECQNSLKQLDSGLKANAAEFEDSTDAMRENTERIKLLKKGYEESVKQANALGDAVEWSKKEYGELSKETTRYVVAQNKARENAAKFAKELEEANRSMGELGRDASRVGRQLENGIGDAADDVSRKIDGMINALDKDLGGIGAAVDFSAFKDGFDLVTGGIGGAYDALAGLTEGTMDYRRAMSFLEQNAVTAGMNTDMIKNMTIDVASLTGELDGAVEGMSNLMAAGFEEDELAAAVERLQAAVVQFPDTLKFESLAESLQESVATGQAVGQYAEYLERMGADLDKVNESFEEAAEKGPEAVETVALAWLNNPDAEAALEQYREVNKDLINGQEAIHEWNDEVARTADILQPLVMRMTEISTQALGIANDIMSGAPTIDGEDAASWWAPYRERTHAAQQESGMGVLEGFASGLDATKKQLGEWFDKLFEDEDTNEAIKNAETAGENVATMVGNGIAEGTAWAVQQAQSLWQAISDVMSRPIKGPTVSAAETAAGTGSGHGTDLKVDLSLDGKKLTDQQGGYISDKIGSMINREELY